MYAVVLSHNFDADTRVTLIEDPSEANDYLKWLWNEYHEEEVQAESRLIESGCYCRNGYGRVTWEDGCMASFEIVSADSPEKKFKKYYKEKILKSENGGKSK